MADFSRVLAGPYCTMLLADLGADVIKVESPGGDDTRQWMPPVNEEGRSTYFLAINRNKRSVALNLKDAGDLAAARELARRADVFVQNFKPGGLARYGLDYESVSAANPAIVYASISGFGAGGGKDLPGYDLMVQAMSGLMSLTGDPAGPPFRAGISVFDVIAGLHTAFGIVAALYDRAATGAGQHVQANLLSSALSGMVNQTSAWVTGGVVPFRMGNAHPSLFPYEPLPTGDGELIVTAGNDAQFARLCQIIGAPELAQDPKFARNEGRTANRDELRPLLAARLSAKTAKEWFDELIAAGVPCGPINTVDGGVAFATEVGLEPVVLAGPPGNTMRTVRHPLTFSRTPPRYHLPPPRLDEHGAEIRAWLDQHDAGGQHRMTQPDPVPSFPTSLGTSSAETITLLGQDLAADLMGKVGFGELALWLVTQQRPTAAQVRVFEAVLVALADHGFTPTAMAARLTYLSAPDSVQGALAAGLLGGGSRFLGVTEDAGQFLSQALAGAGQPLPADDAGWDALAVGAVTQARAAGKFIPGLGHPVHKVTDPRTPVLIQIAEEEGLRGPHLRLFEAIGRVHPQVLGRTLPLNGAGTCGAALADLGLPPSLLRGFALLARAAGILGHLAEEQRRPVGMDMYLTVDRNTEYLPPDLPPDPA